MEPWVAPGDGADHITALPLELRARIAGYLPFQQVPQLATLSRPWRHIHRHAPVVNLDLDDFDYQLDEDRLARLEFALARRCQDGSASKVDTLRITSRFDRPFAKRHAGYIIALANAREIYLALPHDYFLPKGSALTVDLSPSARDLELVSPFRKLLKPIVVGPGAAALQTLRLTRVVLREWPHLPSLRSLTIDDVEFEAAAFQPFAYFPRLENLCIFQSEIVIYHADIRLDIDIRLPLLKRLTLFNLESLSEHGHFTIDAPELEELNVGSTVGWGPKYQSFTLRAPRLRCLTWSEVCAECVGIHVGRPGSVTSGRISFTWSESAYDDREMKDLRAQMMQMLEGLLPELPPECVSDAARPYISFDMYTVEEEYCDHTELIPEEKLTCDLSSLMSSLKA